MLSLWNSMKIDSDCQAWNEEQEPDRRHRREVEREEYKSLSNLSNSEKQDRISQLEARIENLKDDLKWSKSSYESESYRDSISNLQDEINDLSSSSSGGCYLTTAAVYHKGEADNGYTLTTLRNFRDNYMRATPEGEALVQEYYKVAPGIVEKVNLRDDSSRVWDLVYREVGNCVSEIEADKKEPAQNRYVRMTKTLERLTK